MAEFVALATWLRAPQAEVALEEPPIAVEVPPPVVEAAAGAEHDELLDDVCARVRRFRAMLADAHDYVQQRGEPREPLRVRVHPSRRTQADGLGLPCVDDAQLDPDEAVIELTCGSIDTRLLIPFRRLFAQRDAR